MILSIYHAVRGCSGSSHRGRVAARFSSKQIARFWLREYLESGHNLMRFGYAFLAIHEVSAEELFSCSVIFDFSFSCTKVTRIQCFICRPCILIDLVGAATRLANLSFWSVCLLPAYSTIFCPFSYYERPKHTPDKFIYIS